MTLSLLHFVSFSFIFLFRVSFWMCSDTMYVRDMYQVYEIKDDFWMNNIHNAKPVL